MSIKRLARWALISAVIFMGGALLATVWSTHRGVDNASETLVRGQADVFHDGIRFYLIRLGAPASDDDLAVILKEHRAEGLRYIAVLDRAGRVVAEAGSSLQDRATLEAALAHVRPGTPVDVDDHVRVVYRRPRSQADAGRTRTDKPSRGYAPFVIEFEPRMAAELRKTSGRTLGIGALAAGAFLIVALGLMRWFLHREALERQLEHERRLASIGEMSAVLAHEIRNPLASLKGNAQLLARSLPEGEKPRAKAMRVVDEAVRLEALTNDLLEFARAGELKREEVDPAGLLREAAAAVDGERIGVDTTGAPALWPLDGERMRQVLTNLLENAVQADGSGVTASVSRQDRRLEFVIRDRGEGIPEDDLGRIFEPFYTRRTRGTGLGLAVAKRLVELHGGTISAANAADGGAIFRIVLPRTRAASWPASS
jgi:two-component system, NtrC family, sensor histidine kinase HydH